MRSAVAALTLLASALLLAGCSSVATSASGAHSPSKLKVTNNLTYLQSCMTKAGFSTKVTWDGGLEGTYANGQQSAYDSALQNCSKEADTKAPPPTFDQAGMAAEYDKELANYKCIEAHGYSLPEPPSLQTYIDSFQDNRWEAYSAVPLLGQASYKKLFTSCRPPSWNEN